MFHVEQWGLFLDFDITIVGGGHAGVEAAWIASQFDIRVAIISLPEVELASTPCNPAIGGVGKGQVVREIDSLGGLMGKIADASSIQFRILNESKGYAVQATRSQVDKEKYATNARRFINEIDNITVIEEKVKTCEKLENSFLITTDAGKYETAKVIFTTGTFLGGKLHTGEEVVVGGRVGAQASGGMGDIFDFVEKLPLRFKTGTPARLDKATIDFSVMIEQESDPLARNFHCLNKPFKRAIEQVSCYLTRTNEQTLGIIRENKERSPIFNGQIKGIGPRYCPSIEDKAFRYPDRNEHHVFIEPEGLDIDTIYPNGVSTSLPKDVQEEFYKTIKGLENVKIKQYGYAVEYDVVDTSMLDLTLQYKNVPGLYFAGQVNGTSGYEEAAGQGYIAGVNAALAFLGQKPLVLSRDDSYIGVMIEDLVSNKRDEPYRLFSARAENRLFIRDDNAIIRMFPYRNLLGLNLGLDKYIEQFIKEYSLLTKLCHKKRYRSKDGHSQRFQNNGYGNLENNMLLADLLKRANLDPVITLEKEIAFFGAKFSYDVLKTVAISIKYEGYIERANEKVEKFQMLEKKNVDWQKIVDSPNISFECKQRIKEIRPETFSQLKRINGIRPATLAYVVGNLL